MNSRITRALLEDRSTMHFGFMGGATLIEDLDSLNHFGYLKPLWFNVEITVTAETTFYPDWDFKVLGLVFQARCTCMRGGGRGRDATYD